MSSGLPGYTALTGVTPREILYAADPPPVLKPGGVLLDGANGKDGGNTNTYDLRAGWLLGRITATGKYVPLKRTQVNLSDATVTALVVDNSYPFVVGDVITVGADTGITITAINYTTHTLTIASTAVANNEAVFAEDGSGICRGILYDFARLRNVENTAAADKIAEMLIDGVVDQAYLLGDVAAVLATWSSHYLQGLQIWSAGVRVSQ